jgi:phosphatidate cytidylyltransferase
VTAIGRTLRTVLMSELSKRVLFAIAAGPVALAVLYLGGPTLVVFVGFLSGVAAWEFYRLAREWGAEPFEGAGVAFTALAPAVLYAREIGVIRGVPVTIASVLGLSIFAAAIWLRGPARRPMPAVTVTVFGIIYSSMLSYLYALRYHRYAVGAAAGAALVALPLLVTWATDVGAYWLGRSMGKSLLIPSVSPKKTWAGAAGGLGLAIIVAILYVPAVLGPLANLSMPASAVVAFGALTSIAAQTGDIAESLLKREAKVKDSSHLIPGHGGVLDRVDSLLFSLPVAYLLLSWWLIPVP